MINESNFHIYLDDFVNGLLDEEMELAFVAFLDQHPGILDGEELAVPNVSLNESFIESLKKPLTLDRNNTDEWLIASMEGDLSTSEEQQLASYIAQHPSLEEDKALIALTFLKAEETLVFPNRDKLKHRPAIYLYARWSSAVAAILLLGFLFFRPSGNPDPVTPLSNLPETPTETVTPGQNAETPKVEVAVSNGKEKKTAPDQVTEPGFKAEPKRESNPIISREIEAPLLSEVNIPVPSLLPVEEAETVKAPVAVAMAKGQSIWQWGYKKIRKSVGEEEIIIPEREIPGDMLDLVLTKVVPMVHFDQNDKGQSLRIGSFEINRKTAKP